MIRLSIYNDKVLVPAKCGSRFLDTIWEHKKDISINQLFDSYFDIETIVVRSPYEHFKSALHTDILHIWNKEWENVLETDIIKNYTDFTNGSHYQLNLYTKLYEYWVNNNKKSKIVKLENLTNLIKDEGVLYNYDEKDYNWKPIFDIWKTKEEIEEYVKITYPNEYNILIEQVKEENKFYLKLLNNE